MYQEEILEHARHPRYRGALAPPARAKTLENRLCGDAVTVYLGIGAGGGACLTFESIGCSLCRASASILAEAAQGLPLAAVAALVARFRATFLAVGDAPPEAAAVAELYGLRRYPTRERCVLLPWEALAELLTQQSRT
jgi:nitrogen fixation NifU-like protein